MLEGQLHCGEAVCEDLISTVCNGSGKFHTYLFFSAKFFCVLFNLVSSYLQKTDQLHAGEGKIVDVLSGLYFKRYALECPSWRDMRVTERDQPKKINFVPFFFSNFEILL